MADYGIESVTQGYRGRSPFEPKTPEAQAATDVLATDVERRALSDRPSPVGSPSPKKKTRTNDQWVHDPAMRPMLTTSPNPSLQSVPSLHAPSFHSRVRNDKQWVHHAVADIENTYVRMLHGALLEQIEQARPYEGKSTSKRLERRARAAITPAFADFSVRPERGEGEGQKLFTPYGASLFKLSLREQCEQTALCRFDEDEHPDWLVAPNAQKGEQKEQFQAALSQLLAPFLALCDGVDAAERQVPTGEGLHAMHDPAKQVFRAEFFFHDSLLNGQPVVEHTPFFWRLGLKFVEDRILFLWQVCKLDYEVAVGLLPNGPLHARRNDISAVPRQQAAGQSDQRVIEQLRMVAKQKTMRQHLSARLSSMRKAARLCAAYAATDPRLSHPQRRRRAEEAARRETSPEAIACGSSESNTSDSSR